MKVITILFLLLMFLPCPAREQGMPPLAFSAPEVGVAPGQSFNLEILVGSQEEPVMDLYGLGFELHYDPAKFLVMSAAVGPFLGSNLLQFVNINDAEGVIAYSQTRTSAPGVTGWGRIANVAMTVRPEADCGSDTLRFENIDAINSQGLSVPLRGVPGPVFICIVATQPSTWTALKEKYRSPAADNEPR